MKQAGPFCGILISYRSHRRVVRQNRTRYFAYSNATLRVAASGIFTLARPLSSSIRAFDDKLTMQFPLEEED